MHQPLSPRDDWVTAELDNDPAVDEHGMFSDAH
jgi:hypothetical protein